MGVGVGGNGRARDDDIAVLIYDVMKYRRATQGPPTMSPAVTTLFLLISFVAIPAAAADGGGCDEDDKSLMNCFSQPVMSRCVECQL